MSTSLVICSQKVYNVQINNISRTFLSLQLLFINYNVSSCNVVFPQMIVFHCKKEGVLSCFLNSTRLSFLFTQKIWKSKYNSILNIVRNTMDRIWTSKEYCKSKQGLVLWPLILKSSFIFTSSIHLFVCAGRKQHLISFLCLFHLSGWLFLFFLCQVF